MSFYILEKWKLQIKNKFYLSDGVSFWLCLHFLRPAQFCNSHASTTTTYKQERPVAVTPANTTGSHMLQAETKRKQTTKQAKLLKVTSMHMDVRAVFGETSRADGTNICLNQRHRGLGSSPHWRCANTWRCAHTEGVRVQAHTEGVRTQPGRTRFLSELVHPNDRN